MFILKELNAAVSQCVRVWLARLHTHIHKNSDYYNIIYIHLCIITHNLLYSLMLSKEENAISAIILHSDHKLSLEGWYNIQASSQGGSGVRSNSPIDHIHAYIMQLYIHAYIIPFGHKRLQIYNHIAWTVSRLNREKMMICRHVGSLR